MLKTILKVPGVRFSVAAGLDHVNLIDFKVFCFLIVVISDISFSRNCILTDFNNIHSHWWKYCGDPRRIKSLLRWLKNICTVSVKLYRNTLRHSVLSTLLAASKCDIIAWQFFYSPLAARLPQMLHEPFTVLALSVHGVEHLQILCCLGVGHWHYFKGTTQSLTETKIKIKMIRVTLLKGAVSHALRMLKSLKSVQPNKKSNWSESPDCEWKSFSIVANRGSFCILSIYLNYLDIRFSCYSNFLENCGNPKHYLAKDVGPRR